MDFSSTLTLVEANFAKVSTDMLKNHMLRWTWVLFDY